MTNICFCQHHTDMIQKATVDETYEYMLKKAQESGKTIQELIDLCVAEMKEMLTTKEGNKMKQYVIVRSKEAGVFAGHIESRTDSSIIMRNARRLWFWDGAASLSQLAMEGTNSPNECKFPCEVDRVEIFGVIEILDTTKIAQESIKNVRVWSA